MRYGREVMAMKTMKKIMMVLAVMVMAVMVLPSTSAKAATYAKLNKKKANIVINDAADKKKKLTKYTLKLKGASKSVAKKAKWSSSNKKIAVVNQKGVVTGKKLGRATITCKVNGRKYTCLIGVIDAKNGKTLAKSVYEDAYFQIPAWYSTTYAQYYGADNPKPGSTSRFVFGCRIKVRGYYYFYYNDRCRDYKNKVGIKEGRLKTADAYAKCNQDPEYKKRKAEEKRKEDEKAAQAIRDGKAEDEARDKEGEEHNAQLEAEAQAKAEAEAQARAEAHAKANAEWRAVEELMDAETYWEYIFADMDGKCAIKEKVIKDLEEANDGRYEEYLAKVEYYYNYYLTSSNG